MYRYMYRCIDRLQRSFARREAPPEREAELIGRTLWLTYLPTHDLQTGRKFQLENDEFGRVEQDLREALAGHLRKQGLAEHGPQGSCIEEVRVIPAVQEWKEASERRSAAERHLRDLEARRRRAACAPAACCCRYRARLERAGRRLERLAGEEDAAFHGAKGMSGSAFVTFRDRECRAAVAREAPGCCQARAYAPWNFGRPPFAHVTLGCWQAPHPSDVVWENLHVTPGQRLLRSCAGVAAALALTLALVAPLAALADLPALLTPEWEAALDRLLRPLGARANAALYGASQLPAAALLAVNCFALPPALGAAARGCRDHLRSRAEERRMCLTLAFLVLSQLLLPLLGLPGAALLGPEPQGRRAALRRQLLSGGVFSAPSHFCARYLLYCAFAMNAGSQKQTKGP